MVKFNFLTPKLDHCVMAVDARLIHVRHQLFLIRILYGKVFLLGSSVGRKKLTNRKPSTVLAITKIFSVRVFRRNLVEISNNSIVGHHEVGPCAQRGKKNTIFPFGS